MKGVCWDWGWTRRCSEPQRSGRRCENQRFETRAAFFLFQKKGSRDELLGRREPIHRDWVVPRHSARRGSRTPLLMYTYQQSSRPTRAMGRLRATRAYASVNSFLNNLKSRAIILSLSAMLIRYRSAPGKHVSQSCSTG